MNSSTDSRNQAEETKPATDLPADGGSKRISFRLMLVVGLIMLLLAEPAYYYFSSSNADESVIPAAVAEPAVQVTEIPANGIPEQQLPAETGNESKSLSLHTEPPANQSKAKKSSSGHQPSIFSVASNTQAENIPTDQHVQIRLSGIKQINPQLEFAYQAYLRGDDISAQSEYRTLLQTEPYLVDALLGMAAIAARQGKTEESSAWYAKALEVQPGNLTAQIGLVNLASRNNPQAAEARLRNLIARHREMDALHAALGDLYAGNGDWRQAQQAYFEAYRLDPTNPQHAFNLAVALDQLGKPSLALQYYRHAQSLLEGIATATLNKAVLESRIAQIDAM